MSRDVYVRTTVSPIETGKLTELESEEEEDPVLSGKEGEFPFSSVNGTYLNPNLKGLFDEGSPSLSVLGRRRRVSIDSRRSGRKEEAHGTGEVYIGHPDQGVGRKV